ncbi:hypothetical protein DRQ25_08120 [Candidatus Fermentibacteria bacterium]|nr:MAG: hypothetical protein DRQ25_08120 [Candidatus Fermentibacteria bacterium]
MDFKHNGTDWYINAARDMGGYYSTNGATKERPYTMVGAPRQALHAWNAWTENGGREAEAAMITPAEAVKELLDDRGKILRMDIGEADTLRDGVAAIIANLERIKDDVQIAAEERDVFGDTQYLDTIR